MSVRLRLENTLESQVRLAVVLVMLFAESCSGAKQFGMRFTVMSSRRKYHSLLAT